MSEILATFFNWPLNFFSFLYPTNLLEIYGIGFIILFLVVNAVYLLCCPGDYYRDGILNVIKNDLVITLGITLVILFLPLIIIALETGILLYIIYVIIFMIPRYLVKTTLVKVEKDDNGNKIYFHKSELKSLSRDKYGELFEVVEFEIIKHIIIENDILENHYILVKVENSTKKDGKKKNYYLQVPTYFGDGNHTPKEAVAWTFGLKEDEYNPELES